MPITTLVIGEAWGAEEARQQRHFVGPSGKMLWAFLGQAGIPRNEVAVTNIFHFQPRPTNDIVNLCGPKALAIPGLPAVANGKYLRAEFAPQVEALYEEIRRIRPNLIIALGNTVLSVLLRAKCPISKNRGNLFLTAIPGPDQFKLIATYHPAAVLREWTLRPVVISDFFKAARHRSTPELERPRREIWIEPTLADLDRFEALHLEGLGFARCGVDIETAHGTITEIGFAPSPSLAIVVPFLARGNDDGNYWPTLEDEVKAWEWVRRQCATLRRPVFQNGLYDIEYLWSKMRIRVRHAGEDTMLLTHSLQPEMKKSLGFLGSIHTDEPSWKMMRQDNETLKAEDD